MPLHVGVLLAAAVAMSCVCKTTEAHAALPLHEGLQNEVGTTRMHVHSLAMLVSQNHTAPPVHHSHTDQRFSASGLGRRTQCSRELVTIRQLPDSVSVLEVPRHADVLWGRRPLSEVGVGASVCAADGGDAFNCTASVAVTAVNGVGVATVLSDCVVKPLVRISVPHELFRSGELPTPPLAVRRLDSPPAAVCLDCTMGTSRVATCSDGVDNDGDQLVDSLDESCHASPWASESVNKASIAF
jgi:hypothetical protein